MSTCISEQLNKTHNLLLFPNPAGQQVWNWADKILSVFNTVKVCAHKYAYAAGFGMLKGAVQLFPTHSTDEHRSACRRTTTKHSLILISLSYVSCFIALFYCILLFQCHAVLRAQLIYIFIKIKLFKAL